VKDQPWVSPLFLIYGYIWQIVTLNNVFVNSAIYDTNYETITKRFAIDNSTKK
jgi:hypothetical protein